MKKIDSLRDALLAATPELQQQPARLRMWVDRGSVQARQTESLSFAYGFRLNVLIMELATDISVLTLAITRWLRVNQPELLAPGTDAFTFDVDILDNNTVDVLFEIAITQNVAVTPAAGGKFNLVDLPEPDPLFGAEIQIPALNAILIDGEPLAGLDGG
ncbi:phage tail protein [Sphingomonas koreensis]|uniref:phage tail protein n=1 Tax=Sphingomonas koreensis TaxID=93064 RepID=UPI0008376FDD|nr:phage tail protein [Sphingomonas koreensis]PJI89073.1 tail completion protein R (GpR) [Sphingomonas koreensis]